MLGFFAVVAIVALKGFRQGASHRATRDGFLSAQFRRQEMPLARTRLFNIDGTPMSQLSRVDVKGKPYGMRG
jgi:hypothetical protein